MYPLIRYRPDPVEKRFLHRHLLTENALVVFIEIPLDRLVVAPFTIQVKPDTITVGQQTLGSIERLLLELEV